MFNRDRGSVWEDDNVWVQRSAPEPQRTGQGTWTRCSGGMTHGRPAVQKGTDGQKGTQVVGRGERSLRQSGSPEEQKL